MQLSGTKFRKSFILSTKKWIKCFPEINQVNSRGKSGDITKYSIFTGYLLFCHVSHQRCAFKLGKHEYISHVLNKIGLIFCPTMLHLHCFSFVYCTNMIGISGAQKKNKQKTISTGGKSRTKTGKQGRGCSEGNEQIP